MIVILEQDFPLQDNLSFLNIEIDEILNQKEKVIIYPLVNSKKNDILIHLNNDVSISSAACSDINFLKKIYLSFKSLLGKELYLDIFDLIKQGLSLHRIANSLKFAIKTEFYFYNVMKDLHVNHAEKVIIYSFWMLYSASVGVRLREKIRNSVLITRAHGYDLYENRNIYNFLPARRYILKNSELICPISENGKEYLLNKYSYLSENKVKRFYLGTFDYGINPFIRNKLRLVSCSYLVPVKRVELLILAMSEIKNINFEWIHFGGGPLFNKIKKMAKDFLGRNISFYLKGNVDNKEILEFYKNQSVSFFINVSESEGIPVSIMECLSFGIPAIATNVGGVSEIIENERNGYLMDKNVSKEEIASIIRMSLNLDYFEMCKLRKNARKKWESTFNASVNNREFYRQLHFVKRQ